MVVPLAPVLRKRNKMRANLADKSFAPRRMGSHKPKGLTGRAHIESRRAPALKKLSDYRDVEITAGAGQMPLELPPVQFGPFFFSLVHS